MDIRKVTGKSPFLGSKMRVFPILLALTVSVTLYLVVFEREALLAFASGNAKTEPVKDSVQPSTERAVSVVAVNSTAQIVDSAVLIRGQTEALRQVVVRAETAGDVMSEPLRKGATIEKDQLLCRIDPGIRQVALADATARLTQARARVPAAKARAGEANARVPEAKARLLEAQSRLVEAQINDRAAQKLSKGGFASETRVASTAAAVEAAKAGIQSAKSGVESALAGVQAALSDIEAARAGIQSAEAAIAGAETELNRLEIRAPFGGVLETDTAEIGSFLQPGSVCATVFQLNPIKLIGFLPETEVDKVVVGAQATARLSSGRVVSGKVRFLSRSADPLTRTFLVEIVVPNPDLAIRDGQTVEIAIASDGEVAHLLPSSSMTLNDDGVLGVRLVDADQRALFQPVTILRDTIDGVWLTGLPQQARVIVVGQEYVIDGVKLIVSLRTADK